MNKVTAKKVALAYSGGLDTSVIIPWLKENYGCEVVAVCGDIGQGGEELAGLEEKARKTGASEVHVEDMREEFVTEYLWKLVRSGGVYEHKYLLGTSIARPAAGQETSRSGAQHRLRRAGSRLHRQGQRPGAFRADLQGAGAALEGDRAVARMEHRFARGRHRIRRASTTCPSRNPPPRSTAATATSGTSPTKAARSKTPPTPLPMKSGCSPRAPPTRPNKPAEVTIGFENGVPVSLNGRAR